MNYNKEIYKVMELRTMKMNYEIMIYFNYDKKHKNYKTTISYIRKKAKISKKFLCNFI